MAPESAIPNAKRQSLPDALPTIPLLSPLTSPNPEHFSAPSATSNLNIRPHLNTTIGTSRHSLALIMHIAWLAPHLEAEFAAYRLAEGVTGGLVVIAGSRSAAARRGRIEEGDEGWHWGGECGECDG